MRGLVIADFAFDDDNADKLSQQGIARRSRPAFVREAALAEARRRVRGLEAGDRA